MKAVRLFIPCIPVPQSRARMTTKNGHTFMYDSPKSKKYKEFIAESVKASARSQLFSDAVSSDAVSMVLAFRMPRPKSHYGTGKNKHTLKVKAPFWHTGKPDLDNLVKSVKDALEGVCYQNDSQVCVEKSKKFYDAMPGLEICLYFRQKIKNK